MVANEPGQRREAERQDEDEMEDFGHVVYRERPARDTQATSGIASGTAMF